MIYRIYRIYRIYQKFNIVGFHRALNILAISVRPRGNEFHLQENREEIQHKKEKPQIFSVFACIVTYSSLLPFLPLLVDLTIFEYKNAKNIGASDHCDQLPLFFQFYDP